MMIRQTCSCNQTRESTAAANVGNSLEPCTLCRFRNIRNHSSGIKDMTFPNNRDIARPDQAPRFTLVTKFHVKHIELIKGITKHITYNVRPLKLILRCFT